MVWLKTDGCRASRMTASAVMTSPEAVCSGGRVADPTMRPVVSSTEFLTRSPVVRGVSDKKPLKDKGLAGDVVSCVSDVGDDADGRRSVESVDARGVGSRADSLAIHHVAGRWV